MKLIKEVRKIKKKNLVQELSDLEIDYESSKSYINFSYSLFGLNYFKPFMLKLGIYKAKQSNLKGLDAKLKIDKYVLH